MYAYVLNNNRSDEPHFNSNMFHIERFKNNLGYITAAIILYMEVILRWNQSVVK
jgi:hypothetical protein